MSIPKVKIAVLKNLLIFGEKYLPQSLRLLEGGGVETLFGRMPFEHAFSLHGSSLTILNLKSVCDFYLFKFFSLSLTISQNPSISFGKTNNKLISRQPFLTLFGEPVFLVLSPTAKGIMFSRTDTAP